MFLSIITPTYNRKHSLVNIYDSLIHQNHQDFEWIIVDDGSNDNTNEDVLEWQKEDKINIRYYKIPNGGKTLAVCFAFDQSPIGKYSLVLDSDDFLSENALAIMYSELSTLDSSCIGIVGLKSFTNNELVGSGFKMNFGNYTDIYFGKKSSKGDKLFIFRTEIYKKSLMPPLLNEKFMPESVIYINSSHFGKFKLLNEVLYYGDYLLDGMTNNSRKILIENIQGHIFERIQILKLNLTLKNRFKQIMYHIYFSKIAKNNILKILKQTPNPIFTLLLFLPTTIYLSLKNKI
jgi:glycosyltransferase involved in cell wall biosynthesis